MNFTELNKREIDHIFRCFCSQVTMSYNKKYNLANILILFLNDKNIRDLFKLMLDVDNNFEAVKIFLDFDPTIYKSKYIMKYLNNNKLNLDV